jgi:hypothetical protein
MEPDPALAAVQTYRYLRVSLAALVLLLFVAVGSEWWATGRTCLQSSISGYYYTPAQLIFVGVLLTVGVCLVVLKGNTPGEDLLLNLAGMCAPVVALVPSPAAPNDVACRSVPFAPANVPAAVANNLGAVLLTGAVVITAVALVAVRTAGPAGVAAADRRSIGLTAAAVAVGAAWFVADRGSFVAHAHGVVAIPMFICIIGVVWLNARDARSHAQRRAGGGGRATSRFVPVYRMIAIAMLVSLATVVALSAVLRSNTVLLWVEVVLITLFGAFWVVQTAELWTQGLRRSP